MGDGNKTKKELLEVIGELRQRVDELEGRQAGKKDALFFPGMSEEFYRFLVENIDLGIALIDTDHTIVMTNAAASRLLNKPPGEFIGKKCFIEFGDQDEICPSCPGVRAMATGKPAEVVNEIVREDGTKHNIRIQAYPTFWEDGISSGFIEVVEDITAKVRAIGALERSEERYRHLVETMNEGLAAADENYIFTYVNERFCEMLGYSNDKMVGRHLLEFIHDDYKESMEEQIEKRKKGEAKRFEVAWKAKDGRKIITLASPRPFFGDDGMFKGSIGVLTDITDQKHIQRALEESEEKYRTIFNNAQIGLFRTRIADGKLLDANLKVAKMIGFSSREEALAEYNASHSYVYPDERRRLLAELREKGEINNFEIKARRRDGSIIWVRLSGRIYQERGYIEGVIADISEEKNALEALKGSEEKYRALFEESKDVVFISTPEGRVIDMNPSGVDLFGYSSKEEILQVNIAHDLFVHPEDRKAYRRVLERDGYVRDYELALKRKDGSEINVVVTTTVVTDKEGDVVAYRGIMHDITERKRLEQQFLQSQKMEAIGRLAGGIAHDLNNYLGAITGFAELVKMKYEGDVLLQNRMNAIIDSSFSGSSLIDQLLAFGKKQDMKPEIIDLNRVLEDMRDIMERLIGEDVEINLKKDDDLPAVKMDPSQVEQIIVNFFVNARDAMPMGGKINIETGTAEFDEEYVKNNLRAKPGKYVMLSVSDTGIGIPDEIKDKIFEPFYTTKDQKKSSGLGLATVYGIVEQNKGVIRVQSQTGRGTTFTIYLPAHLGEVSWPAKRTSQDGVHLKGTGKILFVEDNKDVRTSTQALLGTMGYSVIAASNGEEALRVFKEHSSNIDLLVTDVVMPGLSGRVLMEKVKKKKENIQVLFISGYTDEVISRHGIIDEKVNFLQKPFSANDLARKIKSILG